MKRIPLLIIVVTLLSFSSFSVANPGGFGDGDFDMQCGGACHGDSSQNQSSPALLELALDNTAYAGLPVSVTATVIYIIIQSTIKSYFGKNDNTSTHLILATATRILQGRAN